MGEVNTYGWAPENPRKWPAGCTPHRDGWVRWYKGRCVFVAGKRTPLEKVEKKWEDKRDRIDAAERGEVAPVIPAVRTYRNVLSEFLAAMEHRHKTGKPKTLAARTLHNYTTELNRLGRFVHDGRKVADRSIDAANDPAILAAYARQYAGWKASGYDSIISRIGALFTWAVEMEYIERYRPGPGFQRPPKQDIRDERIGLSKSFAPGEVLALYEKTGNTGFRCWVALGVCAAFTNSDIATVPRQLIDLATGVIDFRRKKTGKVRRVIPLPADVVALLKSYQRPAAADEKWDDLFFLTENGTPYSRTRFNGPSCSLNRMFRKMMENAGITLRKGRSFTGLRTTFFNLCPKGYSDERAIIMGRAKGTIDLDHYLEDVGMDRLRHVVNHVWGLISSSQVGEGSATVSGGESPGGAARRETPAEPRRETA
jgi:integrase